MNVPEPQENSDLIWRSGPQPAAERGAGRAASELDVALWFIFRTKQSGRTRMSATTPFPAIRLADAPGTDDPAEARKRMLKALAGRLDEHHVFAKGQFVVWKAGLKNKVKPEYGEPAIVTGVYPSPIYDGSEGNSASPYFQEPLSLVIGVYHDDDLIEFRV